MVPSPSEALPLVQSILNLPAVREKYSLDSRAPIPIVHGDDEFLLRTEVVGLNPIDWKSPDFGFGIPSLPFVAGREAYGSVVTLPRQVSRFKRGDKVAFISTDYRDFRKATYQQYVIATESNTVRIPPHITPAEASAFGVAAVTAVLALGVCGGLNLRPISNGPNLLDIVQEIEEHRLADDIKHECRYGIPRNERMDRGDWVAIWGASSTCAFMINQIAQLAGLRTILVLDVAKHGLFLSSEPAYHADLVVDSKDPERAVDIIRSVTKGSLRFGIDCVGRVTAGHLLRSMISGEDPRPLDAGSHTDSRSPSPPSPADSVIQPLGGHLIGLTGLPKDTGYTTGHSVPVKVFHEFQEVGSSIVLWLERLLDQKLISPPRILGEVDGLSEINVGLDRMRRGEISGGRIVANIS